MGCTHNTFVTETFLDELAKAAGRDPFELRRELLKDHPRHRGVLELAAAKAGWGTPLPAGRARGIAVHESFGSFVANVVEVSLRKDGLPKVERVVCAVDCGVAVNPDVIRAQMEGGIGFGLGAALYSEITLDKGRVVQSNFHDYRTLRIDDMPKVEVHIVPSGEKPSGVGEPGVPPIAPAVANAFFQLTGQRLRRLPFVRGVESQPGHEVVRRGPLALRERRRARSRCWPRRRTASRERRSVGPCRHRQRKRTRAATGGAGARVAGEAVADQDEPALRLDGNGLVRSHRRRGSPGTGPSIPGPITKPATDPGPCMDTPVWSNGRAREP